ncbi:type II secretion system protein [Candidatus Saccharibacteria bacterium]|nr:MAG: type II secretion system protein [Candidatus Saccharibacteria bacterium]
MVSGTSSQRTGGFTIIEVLIVLAVAGLLLAILFYAVPAAQRNGRNYARKRMVGYITSQLPAYANDNIGKYPSNPTEICKFITNYLKDELGSTSCSPTYVGGEPDCVLVTGSRNISVCFRSAYTASHTYIGPYDEISIQMGHWCDTGSGDPITTWTSSGHPVGVFVVWTQLEPGVLYCLDNH